MHVDVDGHTHLHVPDLFGLGRSSRPHAGVRAAPRGRHEEVSTQHLPASLPVERGRRASFAVLAAVHVAPATAIPVERGRRASFAV